MDNILSDWARSPFIPITIHLCTFVPILAHPPIHLPTPATPNSVCLAQILWVIHPYMLSYTLDTHWIWARQRSEEHTSELQSHSDLVCRLLLEKKKTNAPHESQVIVL